jgi:cytochrome c556
MKSLWKVMALTIIAAVIAGTVYAKFDRPNDAIRYRQAVMVLLGQHFGRMGEMLKGQQPVDQPAFSKEAALLAMLSKLPWEAFRYPDSDQGKTQLKSEALKNGAAFTQATQAFETETAGLVAAAAKADTDDLQAQFAKVANTCKSCHSEFRSR